MARIASRSGGLAAGNEFADPVTARRFDMPGHRLGRGGRRIGNVLADLLAVEPAAAVRVARLADEAGCRRGPAAARSHRPERMCRPVRSRRQLTHQQERAGGLRFSIRKSVRRTGCGSARSPAAQPARAVPQRASRRNRKILAVRSPAAGDQPLAAAAANQGWLCIIRPGNIGCHGYD